MLTGILAVEAGRSGEADAAATEGVGAGGMEGVNEAVVEEAGTRRTGGSTFGGWLSISAGVMGVEVLLHIGACIDDVLGTDGASGSAW